MHHRHCGFVLFLLLWKGQIGSDHQNLAPLASPFQLNPILIPTGQSTPGWNIASSAYCKLARRNSRQAKVCMGRALSGRLAVSSGSRMMPVQFFTACREKTMLIWSSKSVRKTEGRYQCCFLSHLQRARCALHGVKNTMHQLYTPNTPFSDKGNKREGSIIWQLSCCLCKWKK